MSDYTIDIFWSEEDGGYIAVVPDLPGCSAGGKTLQAALEEVRIATEGWLEVARERGYDIPEPLITLPNRPSTPPAERT